jgi:hypothetical protein
MSDATSDRSQLDRLAAGLPPCNATTALRRAQMRSDLSARVVRRRRTRRSARALVALLVLGAGWALLPDHRRPNEPVVPSAPQFVQLDFAVMRNRATPESTVRAPVMPLGHVEFAVARPDATRLASWTVKDRPRPEATVGDDELLGLLAQAERPAGLIRVGPRVLLADFTPDPIRATPQD